MLANSSKNAITAKARAIYGKRLKTQNYNELVALDNVSDIAQYLKTHTYYSKYLKGINELTIHRGQLESLLVRSRFEKFTTLTKYDFSNKKGFFNYLVHDTEISIILRSLILLNANSTKDIITSIPIYTRDYTCFDLMELSKINDFNDLLEVLSHTSYYKILKPLNAPNGQINLSMCEHVLKLFYYKTILESIDNNYKGTTKKDLHDLILLEIELLNLNIIYRMKLYFKSSNEEVQAKIIPYYYKLSQSKLELLIASPSADDFFKDVKFNRYSNKIKDVNFNYIEDYTKRLSFILNRNFVRSGKSPEISFYAFMFLTQIEISNLNTIIEGIRYKTSPDEIKSLLIGLKN